MKCSLTYLANICLFHLLISQEPVNAHTQSHGFDTAPIIYLFIIIFGMYCSDNKTQMKL